MANSKKSQSTGNREYTHWFLIAYDFLILLLSGLVVLCLYTGPGMIALNWIGINLAIAFALVFISRIIGGVYRQIWRYGGIQCYIRLLMTDGIAFFLHWLGGQLMPEEGALIFPRLLSLYCVNLLAALALRMIYRYAYKCGNDNTWHGKLAATLFRIFSFNRVELPIDDETQKIKVAIVGAGRVGVSLAEDLLSNPNANYSPRFFIDTDPEKVGRQIHNLKVYSEEEATLEILRHHEIQEIIFAIPSLEAERRKALYELYKQSGCKLKVYDYPTMLTAGGKRQLRPFDIEELLFRKPIDMSDPKTAEYYRGKVVLITGGGGSIGSELSRQVAAMGPKTLICLDIYENGVYDNQQRLKIAYGDKLDMHVEIVSVCNRVGLERVFETYHPDIVIHAAAHKHVPLMEHNVIEAVENNVFGTLNVVELSEQYKVSHFIMVSTDKAVNPTNVMGATKRMCEMIVMNHSQNSETIFSATRFGNVLGSAGSVIPLFKRQIAAGGPVTLTDKKIIRYFMTIPEASQLVLQSGAMAKTNELFVLDMGKPVKILEMAENMIRLAGFEPYKDIDIQEIGLRPGEKLYEELLIKTEELDKTENSLIFIERDEPLTTDELSNKLSILREAVQRNDETVRKALHAVVPTYKTPEEVNSEAEKSREMNER